MNRTKRLLDLALAIGGFLILWPVFLGIAAAIKLDDRGPVFFRQLRVGRHGRPFRIWKFRTMVPHAEQLGSPITVDGDPRVTRAGARLRARKADELPQLFNILAGEMSFVGPRPELPRYVERYTDEQRRVLELVPGITDPASLRYRDEGALLARADDAERLYTDEILPEKVRLNLEYARSADVWTDLGMVLRTVVAVVRPAVRMHAPASRRARA